MVCLGFFSEKNRVWFPNLTAVWKRLEIIHFNMSFRLLISEFIAHFQGGESNPTALPLLSFPFPAALPFWDVWQRFFGGLGDCQQVHNFLFALASLSVKGA